MYAIDISIFGEWRAIAGDAKPTSEINELISYYNIKALQKWAIKFFAYTVKYNLSDVAERFKTYYNLSANARKGNTLENHILRLGKDLGTARYLEKNKKSLHSLSNFIKRYGEVEGLKRYNRCIALKSGNKKSFILRYGEAEGTRRYEQFCNKNRGNHSIERKIEKGLSVEEATLRVKATRTLMSKNNSENGFIEKHGVEVGSKLYKERHRQLRHFSSAKGFEEKYGENYKEYLRLCKDRFSLERHIRIYGEADGPVKYREHCARISYRQSLQYFIDNYGEVEGYKKYEIYKQSIASKFYSAVSQQLFDSIKSHASTNIYYATHNKEFLILTGTKCYYYDFVDNDTKRVIEFNGDIFHANPQIYTCTDRPNPFRQDLTSADIWALDAVKNEAIITRGYDVLIVWEKEYRTDYNNILKKCKRFLKYGKR